MSSKHLRTVSLLVLLCAIAALAVVGLWKIKGDDPLLGDIKASPQDIMDTESHLIVVFDITRRDEGQKAIKAAELALREVEAKMSRYIEASDVSQFNGAVAGPAVPLSDEVVEVLLASEKMYNDTAGTFDITIRPLIDLWKKAAKTKKLPDPEMIMAAREKSNWSQIRVFSKGAMKSADTASVDLGGIAKGYAIDKAVEAMQKADCRGGLVEVGGDIRCFGLNPQGKTWSIDVRDPFGRDEPIARLEATDVAVCTSGNYERFSEIEGRHYSHIIDPRTGRPVDFAPSVTVIAPTAMQADAWATALSVLGTSGLKMIPAGSGIEAMLIVGTPEKYTIQKTPGFDKYVVE